MRDQASKLESQSGRSPSNTSRFNNLVSVVRTLELPHVHVSQTEPGGGKPTRVPAIHNSLVSETCGSKSGGGGIPASHLTQVQFRQLLAISDPWACRNCVGRMRPSVSLS